MNFSATLYGFSFGLSLIVAIGAQNAFVLKQGLKNQHVFVVCLICALSDSVLIALGVFGFAKLIEQYPFIISVAKYFGALFLFIYGLNSFYRAYQNRDTLTPQGAEVDSLAKIVAMCLAFTWLNPHVYLDTVVLMGSISASFLDSRYDFALGAMVASWVFFFGLGYGARLLMPIFQKPIAWRILDGMIGVVMWWIAVMLLLKDF